MPNDGREYTFKFNVDNKSLQSAADNIAQTLNEAIKDGTTLDRSSISSVKSSLGQIFGVAEKEAENLKRAMSGITKLDDSQIKMMADNLGDVLNVASQITEAMKATGNSLDWMKQGATLVDDFRNLKAAVDKVPLDKFEAMEASITRLSTQFQGFIDAFKVNDPAGFFKRFGVEAEKEAKHIESIKARLEKATKDNSLRDAVSRGKQDAYDVEEFIGLSAEDIDQEYINIKQTMVEHLEDIQKLKNKYIKNDKVDYSKLYKDENYKKAIQGLSEAYYTFESLQKASRGALGINVNTEELENVVSQAVTLIKDAKSDLETVIKGLDLKDIELSVVLPDAKSAEFSAKINEFIDETKNQLNAKPIKVDIDLTTPVKTKRGKNLTKGQEENAQKIAKEYTDIFNQIFESKEGEEVDKRLADATSALFDKQSTVSAQKFLESFLKVVKTVTNSQDLLLEATKKWRNEIDEQLKLKFAWQTRENEADHKADLAWLFNLANQEAAKNPILLTVDDEYFLGQIENALKERTFTLNADVGTVTGNIAGNINVIPSDDMYQYQPQIQVPAQQQPVLSNIDDTSVEENTDAVHQSTETSRKSTAATNALERAVVDLGQKIQRNETRLSTIDKNIKEQQTIAEQNSPQIKEKSELVASYEQKRQALIEPNKEMQSKLVEAKNKLSIAENEYISQLRTLNQKLLELKQSGTNQTEAEVIGQEIEKLKTNFQKVKQELEIDINNYSESVESFRSKSNNYLSSSSRLNKEIYELSREEQITKSSNAFSKLTSENKGLKQRKQAIEKLIESGDNPITLVTNSINRFWTKSEQSVTSAMARMQKIDGDSAKLQKELYSLESAFEKTEQGTDAYNSLAEQIATVRNKLQESLNKLSDKDKKSFNNAISRYDNELKRQSFMGSKGLIKGLDNGAVEALLKKSPTLAYDLSHMKDKHADLSDTQSIQNLAYFTSVVQENMGMVAKTASEWETDNDAQERFMNMFKIIRYINDLNKLLVNNQNGADEASIQKFIDTYKHIPDMQNAVTAATTYLDSVYKLSEHTKGNELYQIADELGITGEYFADAVKKAWDKLSNTEKTFMETKGIKVTDKSLKYNQKVFEDESQYSISKNVLDFVDVLKTHAEYKETQGNLNRMLQETSRRFTSGTKSGLRVMLDDEKPLAVRVVDANGAEKIYGIQRKNTARINADRSFNTTSSGLENFLKESGLYDVINEIVDKELSTDENDQKLAKQLKEELFSSGKYKVSSQRDAFVKTSGKDYKFKGSSYEQALQKRDAITKELERLNSQEEIDSIKILKEQKTQELAAVNAFLQSQEERVAAIAALDEDIAIAEAKLVDKKQSLDAYNKTARNLTGSRTSRGELYKAQQKRIRAITGSRAVSVDELGDQLNVAQQYGTMDSSVVSELQTMLQERNALFTELQQMSKNDQKDSQRGKEIKKQLADYRTQIARKFYETDGWYITELLSGRLKEIEHDFDTEKAKIDSGQSSTDIASIQDAKQIAEQIAVQNLSGSDGKFKSDAAAMAEVARKGAENAQIAVDAAEQNVRNLKAKKDALQKETEATNKVVKANEEAAAATRTNTNITGNRATSIPSSSGGYVAGGIFNTSGLATENTLRGIYELLNGGAPAGGWDSQDSAYKLANGINKEIDLSVSSFTNSSDNFINSVQGFVNAAKSMENESMALFNKLGQVGELIKGTANGIEGSDIKAALQNYKDQNVQIALHNHPDGIKALSPSDVLSATAFSSGHGVGISGSVADGVITAVDFSGIDKEVGLAIVNRYKEIISASEEAILFDLESFELWPESAQELNGVAKDGLSHILNTYLKQAITDVVGSSDNIFKQVNSSNIGDLVAKTQQEGANEIVNKSAETAKQTILQTDLSKISVDASKEVQTKILEATNGFGDYISGLFDNTESLMRAQQGNATINDVLSLKDARNSWNEIVREGKFEDVKSVLEESVVKYVESFISEICRHADDKVVDSWTSATGIISTQLTSGGEQIHTNQEHSEKVQRAKEQVAETIVENAAEAAKQAAVKADITVDKGKLDELKTKLDQRYQKEKTDRVNKVENPFKRPDDEATLSKGIGNISNSLFQDYSKLNKNQANAKLTELANGYIRLQKFIETELYKSLQEDTKEIINNAIKSAKSVLDANGIQIRGKDTLVGKVIQESYLKNSSGQTLIKGSRKNNPAEAGKIISSVNSPAIIRGQDVLQPAFVTSHKPKNTEEKKLMAEVLGLEQKKTQEKDKQNKLETDTLSKEKQSAEVAQKQVKAEEKITEKKNEQKAAEIKPTSIPKSNVQSGGGTPPSRNIPLSDNTPPSGGIIGILNKLAREETLSSIAKLISSKGGSSSGETGSGNSYKHNEDIDAKTALSKLQAEAYKFSGVTKISDMRAAQNSYSLDVYRQELDKIEKVTLRINKTTGEITSKSGFQDLALGANAAEKELQKVVNIQEQLIDNKAAKYDDAGNLFGNNDAVNKFLSSSKELRDYRDSLSTKELFAPENQKRLSELTSTVQNYRKQVEVLLKTSTQFSSGDVLGSISDPNIVNNMSQVKQVMSDLISQSASGQVTFGNLKVVTDNLGNSYYTLSYQMKNGKHEVQEMTAVLNPLTHEIIAQKGALKPVQTGWEKFFAGFKGKLTSITQYMASITSIHAIISQFRQGLQYVKEIDAAMTELKKVTDETDATYQKFLQTASKTAGVIGSTVKDFTNATADFARLGYNINEASQLAEASLIYKNVGDGFSDVSEASESIISTMKAFGIEATDTMGIVDRFNEVGKYIAQVV